MKRSEVYWQCATFEVLVLIQIAAKSMMKHSLKLKTKSSVLNRHQIPGLFYPPVLMASSVT